MDLSIVLGGRDDNYGENFIERLNQALSTNLENLDKSDIDYEMLVVDFNPIDRKYLHQNELLKESLSHQRVTNIIVDPSVSEEEDLSPQTYYEYFAKNVGARNSKGALILTTNSDIILSQNLIDDIKSEISNDEKDELFYRCRFRGEIQLGTSPDESTQAADLHNPSFSDSCICGLFSGDATMFSRHVFFEVATGYNEGEKRHRTHLSQSAMDGEILWNVYKKGKKLKFLESPYYHINHGRPNPRDNFYSQDTYTNKPNWGFVDYRQEKINENTILITK
jgi:hypothetical protein